MVIISGIVWYLTSRRGRGYTLGSVPEAPTDRFATPTTLPEPGAGQAGTANKTMAAFLAD